MFDILQIGYDNANGDIPVLTIMRQSQNNIKVINHFENDEAEKIYKILTGELKIK